MVKNYHFGIEAVKFYETQILGVDDYCSKIIAIFMSYFIKTLGKDTYNVFSYFQGNFCYHCYFSCQLF